MYSSQNEYFGLFSRSSLVTKEQYSLTVRLQPEDKKDLVIILQAKKIGFCLFF